MGGLTSYSCVAYSFVVSSSLTKRIVTHERCVNVQTMRQRALLRAVNTTTQVTPNQLKTYAQKHGAPFVSTLRRASFALQTWPSVAKDEQQCFIVVAQPTGNSPRYPTTSYLTALSLSATTAGLSESYIAWLKAYPTIEANVNATKFDEWLACQYAVGQKSLHIVKEIGIHDSLMAWYCTENSSSNDNPNLMDHTLRQGLSRFADRGTTWREIFAHSTVDINDAPRCVLGPLLSVRHLFVYGQLTPAWPRIPTKCDPQLLDLFRKVLSQNGGEPAALKRGMIFSTRSGEAVLAMMDSDIDEKDDGETQEDGGPPTPADHVHMNEDTIEAPGVLLELADADTASLLLRLTRHALGSAGAGVLKCTVQTVVCNRTGESVAALVYIVAGDIEGLLCSGDSPGGVLEAQLSDGQFRANWECRNCLTENSGWRGRCFQCGVRWPDDLRLEAAHILPWQPQLTIPSATTAEKDVELSRSGCSYDSRMLLHKAPAGHPEREDRLLACVKQLQAHSLMQRFHVIKARHILPKELQMVHSDLLLRQVEATAAMAPFEGDISDTWGDAYAGPGKYSIRVYT